MSSRLKTKLMTSRGTKASSSIDRLRGNRSSSMSRFKDSRSSSTSQYSSINQLISQFTTSHSSTISLFKESQSRDNTRLSTLPNTNGPLETPSRPNLTNGRKVSTQLQAIPILQGVRGQDFPSTR